jgi:YHS domain-containing protein
MDRLLSFLVFAALFYLMMWFGCGGHTVHGHGGHLNEGHDGLGVDEANRKDPVCEMQVKPGQGYVEHYQGHRVHFCSKQCLDKFDAQRKRYIV